MKKFLKNRVLHVCIAICMLFCSAIVVTKAEKTNAVNQIIDYAPKQVQADSLQYSPILPLKNSLLGDFTVKGNNGGVAYVKDKNGNVIWGEEPAPETPAN